MIIEEMKKILRVKRLLLLAAFAVLYFILFLKPYVQSSAGTYSQYKTLGKKVSESYGDPLTPDHFQAVNAEYERMAAFPDQPLADINAFVQNDEQFKAYGFDGLENFMSEVDRLSYGEQVDLMSRIYEKLGSQNMDKGTAQLIDLGFWRELVDCYRQEILFSLESENGTSYYENLTTEQKARVHARNKEEVYRLLPGRILDNNFEVLQFLGAFMILSGIFIVLPYMVSDNRSRMTALQYTSVKGRRYYLYKLAAVVLSVVAILAVELMFYGLIAGINGVFDYWNVSVSSFLSGFISWFNLTLGQLSMLALGLCVLLAVGIALLVFCITAYCSNYITAIAWQLPWVVLAGVYGGILMISFTEITGNKYVTPAVGVCGFLAGVVIASGQYLLERKKNI